MSLFIGKNHIALDTVDSTNNYARHLLQKSKPIEGTLISSAEQTAGKGQKGNVWVSEIGKNLTLSYILCPEFLEADKQFFLNMCVCLAVKDFCEDVLREDVKIKWPNDVYYGNEKLGGMLIENSISGSKISSSIVGIGINVNQTSFPDRLPNPVSFAQITNKEEDLNRLTDLLSGYLEKYYLQLRQRHFNFLDKAFTVALFRYQQTHDFKCGEKILRGEIIGVSKDGKLIIQSGEKESRFAFKEVEYII